MKKKNLSPKQALIAQMIEMYDCSGQVKWEHYDPKKLNLA